MSSSIFSPLRVPVFRRIFSAGVVSNFGGLIQGVGAAWMMTTITDSVAMVALVQASTTLPVMLFSLMSGAVADSFDRRLVMLWAQGFMAIVSAALAIFAFNGLVTPWMLLGFSFLIGCGGAFNNPAWQASVGDILPREEVSSAILLNSASFNVTRSVGPAVGGAIVALAGASAAFATNALSYIGLIVVLWRWKPEARTSSLPPEALRAAMGTGIRYVALSPNIMRVLVRGFIFGLTTVVVLALLPLIAKQQVDGNAMTYGLLLGAFGIGAVMGAAVSGPLRNRISNEVLVRAMFALFAAVTVVMAVSENLWLTGGSLVFAGGAWVIALSLFNTTVQLSAPRWVLGRALSLYQMAIFGGMAGGSWMWGYLAEHSSTAIGLVAASISMLLGVWMGVRLPLLSSEVLNLDPLNQWQEPATTRPVEPRSGPIAIAIEYRINAMDQTAFQEAMTRKRRIRRRDGAHDWTLAQDLADPEIWIERFEVPTWLDYVRFHSRTTQADAQINNQVRSLHRGENPPEVRRMLEWKGRPVRLLRDTDEPTPM